VIGTNASLAVADKDRYLALCSSRNGDIWHTVSVEVSHSDGMRNQPGGFMERAGGMRGSLLSVHGRYHREASQAEQECGN
jgi:hypothetical protein